LLFVGFSASILAGFIVSRLAKDNWRALASWLILVILLALNWSYFQPKEVISRTDKDLLSSPLWQEQQNMFLTDYLPATVEEIPSDYYQPPLILTEQTDITLETDQADKIVFTGFSKGEEIIIKRFYFPGWRAKINNQEADLATNIHGFMVLSLPAGESRVEINFTNTPLRQVANWLSLAAGLVFLGMGFKELRHKFLKK
jgi:hypothetical protein